MYKALIAKDGCMCKQKKLLIFLLCCSTITIEKIYSKPKFYLPFISFEPEDVQSAYTYIGKTIYNHPIITFSVAATAALSVYYMRHYMHSRIPVKKKQKLEQEQSGLPKNCSRSLEEFQKSSARWYYPGEMQTTFQDVAGMHEAKAEVYDIVDFLSDSDQFIKMGARIPKGILLSGEPGTGKTLLARAVAGQANVPLCYVNASEFMEAFVGIGAARIRNLFKQAKLNAPCIIFIDEIDSIGSSRSFLGGGGSSEAAQTLNQLLAEMDGFEINENPIIVIAATNRIEVLDQALVRPGRFDRHVYVRKPELKDRIEILHIHLYDVPTSDDLDLVRLARATRGFTGADLACLINDAAILAVREKAQKVTMRHFEEAYDNMKLGRVCKSSMEITDKELWATAVHEAGHALLYVYQKNATPLYKVSIQPRGHTLGVTHCLPEVERYNDNYEQMFASMVVALGGSVAEELVYGNRGTGAISDLAYVRILANNIVAVYGMSDEFRNITFVLHDWQDIAPDIRDRLEVEVHKLIASAEKVALQILTEHRLELDALVALLLEKEVVSGDEVYELCGVGKPGIEFSLNS